jgi:FkbM family methyltransferase
MTNLNVMNALRRIPAAYDLGVAVRDYKSLLDGKRTGTFSQHGEDRFILEFFNKKTDGFYLDIGASHPYRISNTYLLYKNGWAGITVEPIPRLGALHRKWRPRDELMPVAVGNDTGVLKFFEMTPSVLSTLDARVAADHVKDGQAVIYKTYDIEVKTIELILKNANSTKHIDFISIDIEGLDSEILSQIDLVTYKPSLVCVEANDESARQHISATFAKSGYKVVKELGCNMFACPM